MPSPFPGMNPYLEHPDLWQEFHSRFIVAIADELGPQLRPKYRAAVGKRVYEDIGTDLTLVGRPDTTVYRVMPATDSLPPTVASAQDGVVATVPVMVEVPMPEEIRERYLEIREIGTGEVVTTLELLSPSNKRPGKGRSQYEAKRLAILGSRTHLIEVDLIRAFAPLPIQGAVPPSLYRILVSRAEPRPQAALYPFNLADPIPPFPLPLKPEDADFNIELQPLLQQIYDRAAYDLAIDYQQDPVPPLAAPDQAWLHRLLQQQGYR